ncbi:MAG: hydrogenase maturation protease [Dehalococcoidia bacterium]|nr:hydrogenase maturation protease [Dehalococcoidia bacterium]
MSYVSASPSTAPRTVIVGIGNWLLSDEGVGVHVASALKDQLNGYPNVTVIDGGTSPDSLLLLDDVERLVIVDAVKGGLRPGTVYRFTGEGIEYHKSLTVSLHEWSVADSLTAMLLLGRMPRETVVIGVEPELMDFGTRLSDAVKDSLPEVMRLVFNEIQANRLEGGTG